MSVKPNQLSAGTILPELKRSVTQEHINLYASASQDFNPIHINPEFAKQTPLGGTVAHGMLILAYVSAFMTINFGQSWLTNGKLSARFKAPARPGDMVTVSGKVTKIQLEQGFFRICCEVQCQNQRGEIVIASETEVKLKADGSV